MAKNNRYMTGDEMLDKMSDGVRKKEAKDREDDEIEMSKKELVKEHKNLVKVLRSGDKKAQMAEADKQEKELKEYL